MKIHFAVLYKLRRLHILPYYAETSELRSRTNLCNQKIRQDPIAAKQLSAQSYCFPCPHGDPGLKI